MIRSVLAAILLSFVLGSGAHAQSCSVPITLTNGTNADATQVMANFNAILSCLNTAQAPPRSYLAGLTLSTGGGSANFGIAVGVATSDDATTSMQLTMSSTKTTSAWTVGSGGSLDTGSILNNTWYHVFLIERTDTSVVDVLISLSPTSPTLPTSYTKKRRIGSMKTNGSAQWIRFFQLGDEFLWDVPVNDFNSMAPGSTGQLVTCTVPTGVQVNIIGYGLWFFTTPATYVYFSSPDVTNSTVSAGLASAQNGLSSALGGSVYINVRSNTSGQLRVRSDNTGSALYINTYGWIDTRGRLL